MLADYFLALYSRFVSTGGSLEWVDELGLLAAPLNGRGSPDPVAALNVAADLGPALSYEYILHEQLATAWAEVPFGLGDRALDWLFVTSEVWDAELAGAAFFIVRAKRLGDGRPVPALRNPTSLSLAERELLEDQVSPA